MTEKQAPACSDLCEHSEYIECGDFVCDITGDVTIVGRKPFTCSCPKRRSINKPKEENNDYIL